MVQKCENAYIRIWIQRNSAIYLLCLGSFVKFRKQQRLFIRFGSKKESTWKLSLNKNERTSESELNAENNFGSESLQEVGPDQFGWCRCRCHGLAMDKINGIYHNLRLMLWVNERKFEFDDSFWQSVTIDRGQLTLCAICKIQSLRNEREKESKRVFCLFSWVPFDHSIYMLFFADLIFYQKNDFFKNYSEHRILSSLHYSLFYLFNTFFS